MKYQVVTPFARFENLRKLIEMLQPMNVAWNILLDDDLPFRLHFSQDWIHPFYFPVIKGAFWSTWQRSLNWFFQLIPPGQDYYYLILNDDDFYEPDFFKKIDSHSGEIIICSMKRGHRIPPVSDPSKAHPTNDLIAAPQNMVVCGVGAEQIIFSGKLLSKIRFEDHVYADGMLISKLCKEHQVDYAPEAFVWFNYLEPGRWDK